MVDAGGHRLRNREQVEEPLRAEAGDAGGERGAAAALVVVPLEGPWALGVALQLGGGDGLAGDADAQEEPRVEHAAVEGVVGAMSRRGVHGEAARKAWMSRSAVVRLQHQP